jgi:hypothetical protein
MEEVHYLDGGFATNSTPFWMFPLRPSIHFSRSFFSYGVMLSRRLTAFSAPDGYVAEVSMNWVAMKG